MIYGAILQDTRIQKRNWIGSERCGTSFGTVKALISEPRFFKLAGLKKSFLPGPNQTLPKPSFQIFHDKGHNRCRKYVALISNTLTVKANNFDYDWPAVTIDTLIH